MGNEKLPTLLARVLSPEQCRINFDKVFVFGDNTLRVGMAGQAIIREQKNSVGLATKVSPSEYFRDVDYVSNCKIIDEDIEKIKNFAKEMEAKAYVLPKYGLGTGLSAMQRECPKTFLYLCYRLLEEFNFNNLEFLSSPKM